jgi:glycosyltransferase involved in cell wall biosynthesis
MPALYTARSSPGKRTSFAPSRGMFDGRKSPSVMHVLAPASFGGLERVVQELAVGYAQRGHRVTVAAIVNPNGSQGHPFVAECSSRSIPLVSIEAPPRAYAEERERLRELFSQWAPDLVHTHGYHADVIAAPLARALGKATVSTFHGFTGGDLRNRVYEWLQRRAARKSNAVVAVSKGIQERLVAAGVNPSRVHLIPNTVRPRDDFPSRDEAVAILGLHAEEIRELNPDWQRIGWVGRLSQEKGPDIMLEAVAALRDLPVSLIMVGDGPLLTSLQARSARLGLGDRVLFTGIVPDAGRLLRAFDVVVLSSRTEGAPMVLFEALAAGVPVVATAVGGVPDIVRPSEVGLVPSENPQALATAIRAVLAHPDVARQNAHSASERIISTNGVDRWIDRHEELYQHALAS